MDHQTVRQPAHSALAVSAAVMKIETDKTTAAVPQDSQWLLVFIAVLAVLAALVVPQQSHAQIPYLTTWQSIHKDSTTDNTAGRGGCQICHGELNSQMNGYGNVIRADIDSGETPETAIANAAKPTIDSDMNGYTNIVEINANSQPGWKSGLNLLFNQSDGSSAGSVDPLTIGVKAPLDPADPDIAVAPTTLAFGIVDVGNSSTLTTTITNDGTADLNVTALNLSGTEFSLGTAPAAPFNVAPNTSITVDVIYSPTDNVPDTGSLVITSNDPDEPTITVVLSGDGNVVAPDLPNIDVDPTTLAFGTIDVGNSSTLTTTITNDGTANLSVSALNLSGNTEFSLGTAPATPFNVAPNNSATVDVIYTPTDNGPDTSSLAITSNDPDRGTFTVTLNGTGNVPVVDACNFTVTDNDNPLDFGEVIIDQTSTLQTTVTNNGTASCTITASVASTTGEFTLASAQSITIAANGGKTNVSVSYAPKNAGSDAGTLQLTSNDPINPQSSNISLRGTGLEPNICSFTVTNNDNPLDFGEVIIDQTSTLQTTVANNGTADCTITASVASTTGEFTLASAQSITIAANGGKTNVSVSYAPKNAGSDAGTLQLTSNDPNNPQNTDVALTATGFQPVCDFSVAPSSLAFDTVDVGETSTLQTTVANNGTADCTITASVVSTTGEFTLTSIQSFTVAANGGTDNVSVKYMPVNTGPDTGILKLASNDTNNPQNTDVALTATGFQPVCDFTVAPSSLAFDKIDVGEISSLQATVTNNGTADCTITASVASTTGEFTLASEPPTTVAANGGTADISVDYTPVDLSPPPDTGTLSLNSDDPHNQQNEKVSLTGAGIISPVISFEENRVKDATGYMTYVAPDATAMDKDGNAIEVTVDKIIPAVHDKDAHIYRPGTYDIFYIATDNDKNPTTAKQKLTVRPLVALAGKQVTGEGQVVSVSITLNGKASPDPVIIDYSVSGTADALDHDLVAGSVEITSSNQTSVATLEINIADDGIQEGDETIVITLTGISDNAALSNEITHTIVVTEENVEPAVSLTVEQSGVTGPYVYKDQGPVTVTANAVDPNGNFPNGDLLSYDWSQSDAALGGSAEDNQLGEIGVTSLSTGTYLVKVLVSDGTNLVAHTATLVVADTAPKPADADADTDTDQDGKADKDEGRSDIDEDGLPDYLDPISDAPTLMNLRVSSDKDNFYNNFTRLMTTTAGLRLSLNSLAIQAQDADAGKIGANIFASDVVDTEGNVVDDPGFDIVDGVFDFSVHGLSAAQRTAQVVIPLTRSILANATLRKFSNGLWFTFIETATDGFKSAPSENNECPPPGSSDYKNGLIEFNDCLELTVTDGGPNDADNEANGVYRDPIAVAVPAESSSPSGSKSVSDGGSGASGWWWLVLLPLLLWLHRRYRQGNPV